MTPTFTRIDPVVNYPATAGFVPTTGFGNPPANPPGIPGAADALLETGYLNIVTAGYYTFNLNGDDGSVTTWTASWRPTGIAPT